MLLALLLHGDRRGVIRHISLPTKRTIYSYNIKTGYFYVIKIWSTMVLIVFFKLAMFYITRY